jgi:tyrosyl-tRNA synthetase
MWRYYELLTDLRPDEIQTLRAQCASGARNPRDIKVELAKRIIADFHTARDAEAAEEEFNRVFKRREAPEEMPERNVPPTRFKLPKLLVTAGLAPSMAEARRLIEQGGVRVNGDQITLINFEIDLSGGQSAVIQVGKRHFARVRGIHGDVIQIKEQ